MILADQIKDLEQRSGALERCLNIEQKRIDLLNEEEKTQVPDFWDNPDQAREQLRRVAAIKAWVDDYDAVAKDVEDLALMPEFVKEGVVSCDHGWWLPESDPENLFDVFEVNVNQLVPHEENGPLGFGTHYKSMPCKVYRAE